MPTPALTIDIVPWFLGHTQTPDAQFPRTPVCNRNGIRLHMVESCYLVFLLCVLFCFHSSDNTSISSALCLNLDMSVLMSHTSTRKSEERCLALEPVIARDRRECSGRHGFRPKYVGPFRLVVHFPFPFHSALWGYMLSPQHRPP